MTDEPVDDARPAEPRARFAAPRPLPDDPAPERLAERAPLIAAAPTAILAVLAVAAGVIHLALVPDHTAEWTVLGVAFAVVGWAQLLLGLGLVVRPSRRLLVAGTGLSLAVVAAWAWTRTAGWPIGPERGSTEAAHAIDGLCAALEVAFAVGAAWLVARPVTAAHRSGTGRAAVAAGAAALVVMGLTTAALAAPSTAEHHHDDATAAGATTAHDHGTTEATEAADGGADGAAGTGHVRAACTAPVTPDQQAAAERLVAATRAAVAPDADLATAMATGYRPITPAVAQVVHYANPAYLRDGQVLDPAAPESLVYAFSKDHRTAYLLGAMYLMDDPAATPPQPGGCETVWHAHTNLCLAPGVGMVGTVDAAGTCPPGSANETTAMMLHVWSVDVPAGPFSELDASTRKDLVASVTAAVRAGTLTASPVPG